MKQLETKRLILRNWLNEDLDDFFAYASKSNIGPAAGWPPHVCKSTTQQILDGFIQEDQEWAIIDKETNKLIGSFGLHPENHRKNPNTRMIGYVLDDSYWGKGLMKEATLAVLEYAFIDLKLSLVSVYHYPFNNQSKRVIEKCGFTFEGILRQSVVRFDGMVLDSYCYSMTNEEYQEMYLK